MSLAKAKKYLEGKGYVDHIIELEDSRRNSRACSAGTWCRTRHDCQNIIFFDR